MDIRTRRKKSRRRMQIGLRIGSIVLLVLLLVLGGMKYLKIGLFESKYVERTGAEVDAEKPEIDVRLLSQNAYSRPGYQTEKINNIVIHYTANPGSTALQNREYFEGLKDRRKTRASSHFIVGLEGEIIQCVPTWEVAYASNTRNYDTVSIETCHKAADGAYTKATYESLVNLTAWLCLKFDLTEEDVIRHYDITEKICPKYFVENEDAWKMFKKDVGKQLNAIKE